MASITINVDTNSLQTDLESLLRRTQDLEPLMRNIGGYLLETTKDRFYTNIAPDGSAWKESARAQEEGGKTLLDHGHLRDSINFSTTTTSVTVGSSNIVYAAIHQFGGKTRPHTITSAHGALRFNLGGRTVFANSVNHPGSDIPARPFLGVSSENMAEIKHMMQEYLMHEF